MDIQIGKITHYYDKLGVAVVEVTSQSLKIGDTVKISGHDKEFTQEVASLQIEHEKVDKVVKGDSCGMKVDAPVKVGDVLYLVGKKK
jgi:translation initiation factor IF-2